MAQVEQSIGEQMSARLRAMAGYGPPPEETDEAEQEQRVDFDGGARTTSPGPPDMNKFIRTAAGF